MKRTEVITSRQLQNYAKTLETKQLKKGLKTWSFVTIAQAANPYVIECLDDTLLTIRPGWREAMRAAAERR